jgi:hypothetical protein
MFNMTYALEFHQPNNFTFTGHSCYWPILHVDQHNKDKKLRCDPVFRLGQLPDEQIKLEVFRCYETSYHDQNGFRRGLPQCEIKYGFKTTWREISIYLLQIALWFTYIGGSVAQESLVVFVIQFWLSLCRAYDRTISFTTLLVSTYGPPTWLIACWIGRHIAKLCGCAKTFGLRKFLLASIVFDVLRVFAPVIFPVLRLALPNIIVLWIAFWIVFCIWMLAGFPSVGKLTLIGSAFLEWRTQDLQPIPAEKEDPSITGRAATEVPPVLSMQTETSKTQHHSPVPAQHHGNSSTPIAGNSRSRHLASTEVSATIVAHTNRQPATGVRNRQKRGDPLEEVDLLPAMVRQGSSCRRETRARTTTITHTSNTLAKLALKRKPGVPAADIPVEPAIAPIVAVPKEAVISGAHTNANNEDVPQIQPLSDATNMLTESEASGLDASPVSASAPPATPMPAYTPAITNSGQIASPEDTIMTEMETATATPEPSATPQDTSMTENTPTAQPSASEPLVLITEDFQTSSEPNELHRTLDVLGVPQQTAQNLLIHDQHAVAPPRDSEIVVRDPEGMQATPMAIAQPQLLFQPQAHELMNGFSFVSSMHTLQRDPEPVLQSPLPSDLTGQLGNAEPIKLVGPPTISAALPPTELPTAPRASDVVNEIAKQVDMKDGLTARAPILQHKLNQDHRKLSNLCRV